MMEGHIPIEVEVSLRDMVRHTEWLLDYARRIAQRQIVKEDLDRLYEIRLDIKEAKEVLACL